MGVLPLPFVRREVPTGCHGRGFDTFGAELEQKKTKREKFPRTRSVAFRIGAPFAALEESRRDS
jgi:hypothetical protein